jgi:hypothetical protein
MNNALSSANGPPSELPIDGRGSHEIQFAQRSLGGWSDGRGRGRDKLG